MTKLEACPRCGRSDAEGDGVLVYCVRCGIFAAPGHDTSSSFLDATLQREAPMTAVRPSASETPFEIPRMQPIGKYAECLDVIDDFVLRIMQQRATILEERIKLVLCDKPRWLPERLWRALVSRLIVIQAGP